MLVSVVTQHTHPEVITTTSLINFHLIITIKVVPAIKQPVAGTLGNSAQLGWKESNVDCEGLYPRLGSPHGPPGIMSISFLQE